MTDEGLVVAQKTVDYAIRLFRFISAKTEGVFLKKRAIFIIFLHGCLVIDLTETGVLFVEVVK